MAGPQRLDKLIASCGVMSRSDVYKAARAGRIAVDGHTIRHSDEKVDPAASKITLDGEPVDYMEYRYIMLNKPAGYVCSTDDPDWPTVLTLLPANLASGRMGLFPAGRLDVDSVGLVLLSNDGELAHSLLSPRKHVPKRYYVRLRRELTGGYDVAAREGIVLEDGTKTAPAEIEYAEGALEAYITISEGKFHQVKRMFEALGSGVTYLRRLSLGTLALPDDLPEGEWRYLTAEQVAELKKS